MTPTPPPESGERLDPQEVFAFLANHDTYPVSGLKLAETARAAGASSELAGFFEALPGTLTSESEIVSYAVRPLLSPNEPKLDLAPSQEQPPQLPPSDATLQISDIIENSAE